MERSEQINELAAALSKAQGELKGAKKDSRNPFFKSSYADLASVWDACRDALVHHGLSVTQTTEVGDLPTLTTTLLHSSGQWISGRLQIKPVKDDSQGMGSAMTYARRYALAAIVGVAAEDDDGEASMDRAGETPQKTTTGAQKAAPGCATSDKPAKAAAAKTPKEKVCYAYSLMKISAGEGTTMLQGFAVGKGWAETTLESCSETQLNEYVDYLRGLYTAK